ncbi:peptidyl-dipeptidase dcp [Thraustotheca clavata]|uniref:Peptidyl-dipeptidase dcp n=1 Tax=Thraustotheca clavata TaxID=74557 RepID=A0A1W0A8E0_9STRA|nr:peptidyl-dipeptidase dcp [Thraustotheca clavata]
MVKPYFSLDSMVEGSFDVANKLFGVRFVLRPDIKTYHPDVRVYEVHETVRQWCLDGGIPCINRNNEDEGINIIPIVVNNNNFVKSAEGEPTLLSFDNCVTLFHEFGHACHGILSKVKYNRLSGVAVVADFMELPSQLMEHWVFEPEVLKKYSRHYDTDETIPQDLLHKLKAAATFGQGFDIIEYMACALIDQKSHQLESIERINMPEFEEKVLAELDMPAGIVMRYRILDFIHLFDGPEYVAGYYTYLWAEVLDADAFDAILEASSIFGKKTAKRLVKYFYSAGNSIDPMDAYRKFRGRDPIIESML